MSGPGSVLDLRLHRQPARVWPPRTWGVDPGVRKLTEARRGGRVREAGPGRGALSPGVPAEAAVPRGRQLHCTLLPRGEGRGCGGSAACHLRSGAGPPGLRGSLSHSPSGAVHFQPPRPGHCCPGSGAPGLLDTVWPLCALPISVTAAWAIALAVTQTLSPGSRCRNAASCPPTIPSPRTWSRASLSKCLVWSRPSP